MATTPRITEPDAAALSERVRGLVLRRGDDGYDEARAVWNGMIDRHPEVIVQCTGAADVVTAVGFARDHDLPIAVKAGGHSVAGNSVCDDGLVIDLSEIDDVHVDPERRIARVGAGATLGDLDHETQAFGLATPMGVASITGVAGLTLGGGAGYLSRTFGLACDNLRAADVVTADGRLVRASADEHPDLFWGLRGGGGNFGVVTALEFDLHEVGPEVLSGPVFYDLADGETVLQGYRDLIIDAPDEVSCLVSFTTVPPVDPFPADKQGEVALALVPFYAGDLEDADAALEPFRSLADPILDGVAPTPYTVVQSTFDEATPPGGRYYWKSQFLPDLSDDAIAALVKVAATIPTPMTSVSLEAMGGAVGRVDPEATAYPHREDPFDLGVWGGWNDPTDDDDLTAWVRDAHETLRPFSSDAVYLNYLDRDDDDRVRDALGRNFERLTELKAEWDPDNVFRLNNNVPPATTS